jgi:hypothetical protein
MYHIQAGGTRLCAGWRKNVGGVSGARVISSPGARKFARTLIDTRYVPKKTGLADRRRWYIPHPASATRSRENVLHE